jgi:hypothetical protein
MTAGRTPRNTGYAVRVSLLNAGLDQRDNRRSHRSERIYATEITSEGNTMQCALPHRCSIRLISESWSRRKMPNPDRSRSLRPPAARLRRVKIPWQVISCGAGRRLRAAALFGVRRRGLFSISFLQCTEVSFPEGGNPGSTGWRARSPRTKRAVPKLNCVVAHLKSTLSRVNSFSASR